MLIEVEGPRGVGKTTLISSLCAGGQDSGPRFISAAAAEENDGDPGWLLGAFMRGINPPPSSREAVFLYCARTAARSRVSRALMATGAFILSDRLRLSLYVQACLGGFPAPDAWDLVRLALSGAEPSCTVLLDADYATHRRRVAGDGREPQPEPEFQATRDHFGHAFKRATGLKFRINTSGMTPGDVLDAVLAGLPVTWHVL